MLSVAGRSGLDRTELANEIASISASNQPAEALRRCAKCDSDHFTQLSASLTAARPQPAAASPLFSPFLLRQLALPNRIVMAPLTRARADEHGAPSELAARYYTACRGQPDHRPGHGGVPAGNRVRQLARPLRR